jgi:hypothetical protein
MQTSLYSMTGRDVVQDSVACTIPQACSQEEGQDAQEITETNSIDGLGEPENDKDAVETKLAATIEIQEATIHHQNAEWNELLRKHERLKIKYQELDKQNAALRSLNEVLMAEQQQQAMAPTSGVISHRKGERNGSHETIHESRQDGSYRRDDPATARANLHKYNEAIQFLEAVGCDDFETCLKQWRRDCTAKVKAEEQFQALQKEALNTVDRFVPELDTAMQGAFRDLNKSIGLLTRVDALNKLVLQDLSWDKAVLWPNTLSTAASLNDMEQHEDRVKKKETRLLLRQALWKLYAEELMDPARPFSSFGGRAGHLAAKLDFADWFPDHRE